MSETTGTVTDKQILDISKREYANGVYAESTIAFARALLALAGKRLMAELDEHPHSPEGETIRRILGVKHE